MLCIVGGCYVCEGDECAEPPNANSTVDACPGLGTDRFCEVITRPYIRFKHILFMTEHDKGLGRAKKLCLALSKTHTCTYNLFT